MEKASFNIFLATIVLGLLAFAAPTIVPFVVLKTAIIAIGILVSFILYVISRMKAKTLALPWNAFVIVGGLLGVSIIVSTALSVSPFSAFMSDNFPVDTGAFLLVSLIAAYLGSVLVTTRDRVFMVYITLLGSFSLVALFEIIRILSHGKILSFGLFSSVTSTMVGTWYDFGIFSGAAFILSFLTLELLPLAKRLRVLFWIVFAVSALFLLVVGSAGIWVGVALVSLALFLSKYFHPDSKGKTFLKKLPLFSAIVAVIAILLSWQGSLISTPIDNAFGTNYANSSLPALPWQYTIDVATPTIKAVPFFGAGPSRFGNAYLQFKPQPVNATPFWSIVFSSGYSFVLSSIVTLGLVGFLLLVIFIVLFFVLGFRAFNIKSAEPYAHYTLATSFFTGAFLWLMMIIFVPSHALFLVTFVITGVFIAELIQAGHMKTKVLDWTANKKLNLLMTIICGIVILLSVVGVVLYVKQFVGQVYIQKGVQVLGGASAATDPVGTAALAKVDFQKSLAWSKTDTAYQALAQVNLYSVNAIVSAATSTPSQDVVTSIGNMIGEGVTDARTAQKLDPGNYFNYIIEANVSETAAGLHIQNGYESARLAYQKALSINPLDPSIYLAVGKLDYFAGSTTAAVTDLNAALQIKPDYTDALFEAGVISYDQKDYQTAEAAFAQVLTVDKTYTNAIYFLGLTLIRLGDTKDALTEFTALNQAYPDNQQVSFVLNALKTGKSPFTDSTAAAATQAPQSFAPASTSTEPEAKTPTTPKKTGK